MIVPIQYSERANSHWPPSLEMRTIDSITQSSFQDLYEKAVQNFVPSYVIAVVKYRYADPARKFQIFDGLSFFSAITEDPCEGNIKKIIYCALNCFESSTQKTPVRPEDRLFSDAIPQFINNSGISPFFFFGVDFNKVEKKEKDTVGKAQYVIADFLFTEGDNTVLKKEAIRWLWCACHRGIEGSLDMIYEINDSIKPLDECAKINEVMNQFVERTKLLEAN